jgi:hypothetical protein
MSGSTRSGGVAAEAGERRRTVLVLLDLVFRVEDDLHQEAMVRVVLDDRDLLPHPCPRPA